MCCCNDLDFRFAEGCYIQGKLLHRDLWQWQSEKFIIVKLFEWMNLLASIIKSNTFLEIEALQEEATIPMM